MTPTIRDRADRGVSGDNLGIISLIFGMREQEFPPFLCDYPEMPVF